MLVKSNTEKKVFIPSVLTGDSENKFLGDLDRLIAEQPVKITINCTLLERVTSSHVDLLWRSHLRCRDAGMPCEYTEVSTNLKRVLMILDLYDLLISEPVGFTEMTGHDMPVTELHFGKELHLEFTTEKTEIDDAIEDFRQFLSLMKLPEFTAFELETIFYEVVTNIKLHSCIPEGSIIKVTAKVTTKGINLSFIDRGKSFDPTDTPRDYDPNTAAGNYQKRGYGMVMIKRMTDNIYYERQDDCLNVLTMEKNWR